MIHKVLRSKLILIYIHLIIVIEKFRIQDGIPCMSWDIYISAQYILKFQNLNFQKKNISKYRV